MILDADAALVWEELTSTFSFPLRAMGVESGRAMSLPAEEPAGSSSVVEEEAQSAGTGVGIRVFRPAEHGVLPALVYFHGGGWSIGSVEGVAEVCRRLAVAASCVVLTVDYRQAPEHPFPAAAADALEAFLWAHEAAAALAIDPHRIAVGGDSAGANLALSVALRCRDDSLAQPCFMVLVYPAVESEWVHRSRWTHEHAPLLTSADVDWFWGLYLASRDQRQSPYAVPARTTSFSSLPPTVVHLAEVDPLHDEGLWLAQQLAEAGVPVSTTVWKGVYHGFFTMPGAIAKAESAITQAAMELRGGFAMASRALGGAR